MKKVLVLNQFALPRSEGGGTRHFDLFSRLHGWSPRIVAGNRNHYSQKAFETSEKTFRLVSLPAGSSGGGFSRIRSWLTYTWGALRLGVRAQGIDLVYASTPHLLTPVAGWLVSKVRRVPLVVEVRDLWPETFVSAGVLAEGSPTHRAMALLERWIMRRADHIVVVTTGWEDHFVSLGVAPERVTVIPNGTEVSDFLVDETKAELRRRWNISGTTAVFSGAHGAHGTQNGIPSIIEAAVELPDVNFLFVGDGPGKKPAIEMAEGLGLSNVEFRDPIPKSELPSLLAACDIGLQTLAPLAIFEQGISPNKLFDYMAAGLPIVSNARVVLQRIMTADECGRLGDPNELVDSIRAVAEADEETRAAWGSRARQIVAEKHSRSAAAERLEAVLDDVIASSR